MFFSSALPATAQDELDQRCIDAELVTYEDCAAYLQTLPPAEAPAQQEPAPEQPVAEEPAPEEPIAEEPPQQDNVAQECVDAGVTTTAECDSYLQSLSAPVEDEPAAEDVPVDEPVVQDPPAEEPPAQNDVDQRCIDGGYTGTADCDSYLQSLSAPGDEPTAQDQPAEQDPVSEQPVVQDPVADDPAQDQNVPVTDDTTTEQPTTDEPATSDEVAQKCLDAGYTTTDECNDFLQQTDTPADDTETVPVADPDQPVTSEEVTTPATDLSQECIDAGFTTAEECTANQTTPQTTDDTAEPNTTTQDPPESLIAQPEVDPYADTQPEELLNATEPVAEGDDAAPLTDAAKENPDAVVDESVPVITEETLPQDDADASIAARVTPQEIVAASGENAEVLDAPPPITPPANVTIINQTNVTNTTVNNTTVNNTYVYEVNNTYVINNSAADRDRIFGDDSNYQFDQIGDNRFRETVYRDDGTEVVTVRDQYGNILERYRTDPYGETYVFAYFDPSYYDQLENWRDPGDDLPVLRLNISLRDYVMDWYYADEDEISLFFRQPPVEKVRRLYSIDEVKRSARLRDSVRRLEVGNLNFASGASKLSRNQINALEKLADAMLTLLEENPAETFLIEGHTDAPGSDQANLVLSDQRAASVARILTHYYGVPPENLATQGYGERYLRVRTQADEPKNRRVTIRRITPLVSPYFASN
ncbi:OmpA family protein [Devosia sp.]|uniref:OmpA family protein n=1 Tax=Devosia sp. TaxID=1871048 RepID=UPI003264AB88